MAEQPLPLGKLSPDHLDSLLCRHTFSLPDDRVVVYPGVGEDAAVIDMGQRWLVAKTDPITFATDEIGWYAVHVNANDVAAAGSVPRWFLSTLLLPEGWAVAAVAESGLSPTKPGFRLRLLPGPLFPRSMPSCYGFLSDADRRYANTARTIHAGFRTCCHIGRESADLEC